MKRKIKFGLRIHQTHFDYESLKKIWIEADKLGYHSATLFDVLNPPSLECWTTLSALAGETERISLVPLVLSNSYRNPALLAKMASTLDVISDGRLELGIGAGGSEPDHLAYGFQFPNIAARVEMLEEAVCIIRKLWQENNFDFNGKYYKITNAICEPKPTQKPGPPVLIGGHGKKYLLRAVAKCADMCNIGFDLTVDEYERSINILREHCIQVGSDVSQIELSHNTRVIVAEDGMELEKTLKLLADKKGLGLDEYKRSLANSLLGTPETCIRKLQDYIDIGITYFFLLFPDPANLDMLRLFAGEVMSSFR